MNPALSVVFLTTLIGAGQGLFVAIYVAQWSEHERWSAFAVDSAYVALVCALSIALTALGLVASFFHLGRPMRAWRSAARWRTSWLSREVLALPAFVAATALYGAAAYVGFDAPLAAGAPAALACVSLFVCTGMVYASVRFLQEWASPLTVVNFALMGCASGFTIAAALSAFAAPQLFAFHVTGAMLLTAAALATRLTALARNARVKPRSTLQSAIGIKHPNIAQISQGFMGGSFNTREFFHGASAATLGSIKWFAIIAGFVVPLALLAVSLALAVPPLVVGAFILQAAGLVAERWLFLAQSSHPQNLYYRAVA